MAKNSLNIGTTPNDGTGDSLRFGASKINAMVDEIYQALGTGTNLQVDINDVTAGKYLRSNGTNFVPSVISYADITGVPSIPAAQVSSDWNALSGVAQILNKPNLATVATSANASDLNWAVYNDIPNLPSASAKNGMIAKVTSTGRLYYSHDNSWKRVANYEELSQQLVGLSARTTVSGTTVVLANNASSFMEVTGFKSYSILKIQTNIAAWVTLYTDADSRSADFNRTEDQDPLNGAGVIAEIITTGPQTQIMTPAVFGWNNDSTPGSNIYMKVVNKSGSSNTVTVSLTLLQLEA
jgi:hypothetical protein